MSSPIRAENLTRPLMLDERTIATADERTSEARGGDR